MSRFSEAIQLSIPKPCFGRPFVCDGDPEKCSVVVIGENPVTEMDLDWWSFWDNTAGFEYGNWRKVYEARRIAQGEAPVSPTRRHLDRLRAKGLHCLETNVFMNERQNGPGVGVPNTDLLDLALSTLPNLTYVVAHGQEAAQYLNARLLPVAVQKVYRTRHFRIESYDAIDAIANDILQA